MVVDTFSDDFCHRLVRRLIQSPAQLFGHSLHQAAATNHVLAIEHKYNTKYTTRRHTVGPERLIKGDVIVQFCVK